MSSTGRPTERRIVDVLMAHLRISHAAAREVRHYEKRIDVVAVVAESGEVLAIEAKTENWSRAVAQAVVNLAAVERSYVAMFAANAHRVPEAVLRQHGLGLLAVGTKWGEVTVIRPADRSRYTNRLTANRLRDVVRGGRR